MSLEANNTYMHCPHRDEIGGLFLAIVMSIEMTVGLPGNAIALWIFCFRMKLWKPHTLFLLNLVLADFLLIISVPFRIDTHLRNEDWVFGPVWCRINHFMLTVNRSASIAFMTVVALHRYFKVVHPHSCIKRMTTTQAGWLTGLIWISVTSLSIPLLTTNLLRKHNNISLCRSFSAYKEVPPSIMLHYMAFILEFLLPWVLLLYCSVRIAYVLRQRRMDKQKKVRRAIVAVRVISLVFTICFMPGVITGLGAMYIKEFRPTDCTTYTGFTQAFKVCLAFLYLSSTLDPVIYCFSSSMFRDILKSSICHLCFAKKSFRSVSSLSIND
ncbi:hydroxycarboxylic acid receptor 2 [Anabas testudineus]|uniref:G-protein coupled receptors family 1 profile domain-containing protein n=1 Tax=Anabas testudineus TaxID=64144 RepID=A0A3Q1HVJ0_ANATE|nr:hydroxycarboxylic acid receptor 2 [Anabas testudineus]